jgi:hypothetical protein
MTKLSSVPLAEGQDLFTSSEVQTHDLGARVSTADGRAFKYAKAGELLVKGTLLQAPIEVTNHQGLTPTACNAGVKSVTVTLGGTAATADQYAGGYVVVTTTPDIGGIYKISSHPAQTSTSGTVVLALEDPVQVAWTSATRVDLVKNPYNGVIINPTTATSCPVGVAVNAIASGYYGWIQVAGVAPILSQGGSTVGTNVSASNGTAGTVEAHVDAQATIGVAVTGVATTEVGAFNINLG